MNSNQPVYRWSPKPIEKTLRPDVNTWCLRLSTAQWNIVWLVNPKIATVEASEEWKQALDASWECELNHDGPWGTRTLLELGEVPASVAGTLLRLTGRWLSPPPILHFDTRWSVNWYRRSRLARQDHPWRLNQMMDAPATNTYHAQKLLLDLGLVKKFRAMR